MRSIRVSTHLACDADIAFEALQSVQAFVHVAHGAARFPVAEKHLAPLREGEAITGWVFLFGVIPFAKHTIAFAVVDPATRTLRSNEHGGLLTAVGSHDHHDARSRRLPLRRRDRHRRRHPHSTSVVAYAHAFYRYRQRRWRRLAPVLEGAARVRQAAPVADALGRGTRPRP